MTLQADTGRCGSGRRRARARRATLALELLTLPWVLGALLGCGPDTEFTAVQSDSMVTLAGREVQVELALDDATRQRGLMHRTSLADDRGMLFVFPDQDMRKFWMHDTLIGLDIMFLEDDGVLINVEEAPPGVEQPGFFSDRPCRLVLELRKGWCRDHDFGAGDIVQLPDGILETGK